MVPVGVSPCGKLDTGLTVKDADPFIPSLDAVIVVLPADREDARPLELTVATEVLVLDQAMDLPVNTVPELSRRVAENC